MGVGSLGLVKIKNSVRSLSKLHAINNFTFRGRRRTNQILHPDCGDVSEFWVAADLLGNERSDHLGFVVSSLMSASIHIAVDAGYENMPPLDVTLTVFASAPITLTIDFLDTGERTELISRRRSDLRLRCC